MGLQSQLPSGFPCPAGVGGNLVAIQSSRISTYLHVRSTPGVLPLPMKGSCPRPWATFCSPGGSSPAGPWGHFVLKNKRHRCLYGGRLRRR